MEYARHEVKMSAPQGKTTYRAHLEAAAERGSSRALCELEGPEFPETLAYLWDWTRELRSAPRVGVNGVEPISWADIDSWARLTGRDLATHEVQALIALDHTLHAAQRTPER